MRLRPLFRALAPAVLMTILALLLPAGAWAEPVGHVQAVSGQVTVVTPGQGEQAAAVGMALLASDEVVTGPDGSVQILCADQSFIALTPDSRVRLDDIMYDPDNAADSRFHVEVLQGAAGFLSGQVARDNPENFQVQTPLSYLGIRGTEFVCLVAPDSETHGLFAGGPVAVTASSASSADPCPDLAEALAHFQRSASLFQRNGDFGGRRGALSKVEDVEELMAQHGCRH